MLTSYRLAGTDLDDTCKEALIRSMRLLRADRGVMLLADRKGDLVPRYVETSAGRGEEEFVVCKELAEEARTSKQTIIVADTSNDPRTTDLFRAGIRSVAAFPLHHSQETLGLLYLDSTEPLGVFSETEAQICDLLAGQLSAEIQLARAASALLRTRAYAQAHGVPPPTGAVDDE